VPARSPHRRRTCVHVSSQPRATRPFYTVIDCHSLGDYKLILLSLMLLSVKKRMSSKASVNGVMSLVRSQNDVNFSVKVAWPVRVSDQVL
jgi:hypothetical protein